MEKGTLLETSGTDQLDLTVGSHQQQPDVLASGKLIDDLPEPQLVPEASPTAMAGTSMMVIGASGDEDLLASISPKSSSIRRQRKQPFEFRLESDDLVDGTNVKLEEPQQFQPILTKPAKRTQHFEPNDDRTKKRKTTTPSGSGVRDGVFITVFVAVMVGALAKVVNIVRDKFFQ